MVSVALLSLRREKRNPRSRNAQRDKTARNNGPKNEEEKDFPVQDVLESAKEKEIQRRLEVLNINNAVKRLKRGRRHN